MSVIHIETVFRSDTKAQTLLHLFSFINNVFYKKLKYVYTVGLNLKNVLV